MLKKLLSMATGVFKIATQSSGQADAANQDGNAYQFDFIGIDGKPLPLAAYRDKVLLIVNTASFCGFTPQYKGLQALWESYRERGLVIIGVPCNDFGEQEPGSTGEIQTFCEGRFGITFPLTEKYAVTGPNAHPFYVWANAIAGAQGAPGWNFHKFLISREGKLVGWFPSKVSPEDAKLKTSIEAELAKPA